jgi:gliding motility-associated-like protein
MKNQYHPFMASALQTRSADLKTNPGRGCFFIFFLLFFSVGYGQQQISTCADVPFSFVQSGALAGTTYTWSAPVYSSGRVSGGSANASPQATMQQTLVLATNTTSVETATYQVTPSTGATFTLEVSVVPQPVLSSSMAQTAICGGTQFNYTATSATPGTSINWSRQLIAGISNPAATGQANANEILNNITTGAIDVSYIFSLNASGCRNDDTVVVRVNPTPFLSSTLDPTGICSGQSFNYQPTSIFSGTSFTWQRTANSNINNSNSATGNGNPNEQLVNNSLNTQVAVYTYTLTNNVSSCTGTQVVRVPVYPVANISAQSISACSGAEFMVSPTTAPFGTMYTWSNPTILTGTVSGAGGESVDQYYVHQNLLNTGASTAQLVYTVTPNTFGCRGADFTVAVNLATNVSPATLGSSLTPPDICSGNFFSYQPTTGATNNGISWQRFYANGISNTANTGNGNVNELLTNTTTQPVPVHYAFTINQTNGCKSTEDVVVIVNPGTNLSSSFAPPAICSNTTFSYAPTSATPGTSFTWTRAAVSGISNISASGTGNPGETLINATNNTIAVSYNYSLTTTNGCFNNTPQVVTVLVRPQPRLSSTLSPAAICSGTVFNYPYQSSTAGTVFFNWTRPAMPSLSNGAGAGSNDPAEILVNTSTLPISVPYNYHLTANGCSNDQTVVLVLNPVPLIGSQSITVCSESNFILSPSNVPAATLYSWNSPTINPAGALTGWTSQAAPGVTSISQTLRNQTTAAAAAVYSVIPISGSCTGNAFSLTANIKPVPALANQVLPPICSGTAFNLSSTAVPVGTTYTWSAPVQTPFNSLIGASAQPLNQTDVSQTLRSSNNIIDTAVYFVTPSANNCIGAEFQLTVYVKPVPVVNSIIDTICTGSSFLLAPSSVPVNTTYTWPLPSSTPFGSVVGWSAQATQVPTISQTLTNTTTAPAQVLYTITPQSAGCAGNPFNATIIVGNALAPFANTITTICSGTAFDVTPAAAPAGTTYTWVVPSVLPAGTISGLSAMNTPQTGISQTLTSFNNIVDTAIYTIQPYKTGCKGNVFTATVRVLPSPRALITGKPVICRYPTDTLSVSFTGTGPWTFTYNDGVATRTVSGITSSPYNWVVPVTPAVSSRTLAITGIKDFACSSIDSSYFTQNINPLPVGQIVSLHGNYICHGIPDSLYISYNPAVDTLQFQWTRNGINLPGATTDSISTVTAGRYNSVLTNQYGCRDTAAVAAVLIAVPKPQLNFSVDATCINMLLHFTNLTDTNFIGPTNWTWDMGNNTYSNAFHSTATYAKAGNRHIRLTAVQQYCPAYPTSMDSTFDIQFPIPAMRHPSVSAYSGQTTPLTGRQFPGYRYQWLPSRGIDFPTTASPDFNYQVTQDYIINLISPAGCITPDSMLVRVFDPGLVNIMVPKSFTPNGDGINDILYPYLSGMKSFNYFKVFNRFGQLMFQTNNPDRGWNGTMNGTPQPMAIYIWVAAGITNDGNPIEKRGETLLLR